MTHLFSLSPFKGESTAGLAKPFRFKHYFPSVHFSTTKTALGMKKRTAKKQGCLTVLYSLNNHKQFVREVLQAQF